MVSKRTGRVCRSSGARHLMGGIGGMKLAWMLCVLLVTPSALGSGKEISVITPPFPDGTSAISSISFDVFDRSGAKFYMGNSCWVDNAYKLIDGDKSTGIETPSLGAACPLTSTIFAVLQYWLEYEVKVVRYKIHVGKDTPESLYPRSWRLRGRTSRNYVDTTKTLHKVANAKFENGVFVGKFKNPSKYQSLWLEFTEDSTPGDNTLLFKIAEFEAFGPRGQYDRFMSQGYPCRRAPRYITHAGLKKDGTAFTNYRVTKLSPRSLDYMFRDRSAHDRGDPSRWVRFRDGATAIIGYHFKTPVEVIQFFPHVVYSWRLSIVLEANECDPSCDYLGERGWEVLFKKVKSRAVPMRNKWLIEKPGLYRAYRLKLSGRGSPLDGCSLTNLAFLQC